MKDSESCKLAFVNNDDMLVNKKLELFTVIDKLSMDVIKVRNILTGKVLTFNINTSSFKTVRGQSAQTLQKIIINIGASASNINDKIERLEYKIEKLNKINTKQYIELLETKVMTLQARIKCDKYINRNAKGYKPV